MDDDEEEEEGVSGAGGVVGTAGCRRGGGGVAGGTGGGGGAGADRLDLDDRSSAPPCSDESDSQELSVDLAIPESRPSSRQLTFVN